MSAVQRYPIRRLRRSGDRLKYSLPDSSPTPTVEAIVDRLVRAVFWRTVLPPTSHLQHKHDPAQNAPILLRLWSGKSGSIFAHCSSLNQNKFALMVGPRFAGP